MRGPVRSDYSLYCTVAHAISIQFHCNAIVPARLYHSFHKKMAFRNCTMLAILSLYMLIVFALPSELSSIQKRCTNSPSDRSCWGDYDINTNYLEDGPDTGNTVEVSQKPFHSSPPAKFPAQYYWEVVNVTLAPDGIPREMITVNGSFPGPTIEANWGDTVGMQSFLRTIVTCGS